MPGRKKTVKIEAMQKASSHSLIFYYNVEDKLIITEIQDRRAIKLQQHSFLFGDMRKA